MRRLCALSLSFGVLLFSSITEAVSASALEGPHVIGHAVSPESGQLLYIEIHDCRIDPLSAELSEVLCEVVYEDANGALIARKNLDYTAALQAPALSVVDYRTGVSHDVGAQEDPDVVVDAGFDHYVRKRWGELLSGRTIRFPFLVVDRDKPLQMKAEAVDVNECAEEQLCLEISLDSWLLGLVVDPIRLTYDRQTRRLQSFRGISNIKDSSGNSQSVEIVYRYSE